MHGKKQHHAQREHYQKMQFLIAERQFKIIVQMQNGLVNLSHNHCHFIENRFKQNTLSPFPKSWAEPTFTSAAVL